MEGGPFVALNILRDRGGSYVQWLKNTFEEDLGPSIQLILLPLGEPRDFFK
jgi:hypothetical protein